MEQTTLLGFTPLSSGIAPECDHSPAPGLPAGMHVGVIMDGNGRWALRRGRPRRAGHLAGAEAVRRTVEAAPALGIGTLTLYAFSSDNWRRPPREVAHLLGLFADFLRSEVETCVGQGIRLSVIGRRDRLPVSLLRGICLAESRTAAGSRLHLRIAIDYSGRDALVAAAGALGGREGVTREDFSDTLARVVHAPPGSPDVDLLVRTGGEQRLSDFLLWECAYAELLFLDTPWPDFTGDDLGEAVRRFAGRERRFGAVVPAKGSRRPGRVRSAR